MGFLDDLKKNLGIGEQEEQNRPQTGAGADTGAAPRTDAPAEAATAETITHQDAAARAAAQQPAAEEPPVAQPAADAEAAGSAEAAAAAEPDQQADQAFDVPPMPEGLVEPVAEPELADPVLAEPVLTEPVAADQSTRASVVVVESGDTLDGIAKQYGVDLEELIAANADTIPNPDHIYPGQVLRLP